MDILFEDNHCLAVNKPAPLLTQGPSGVPSLEGMVKDYLREKYGKTGNVYLGVPHRLDRPVSGVILFARNSKAARRLAEQFHERQVAKLYWGVVEGDIDPPAGVWDDWLRKIKEESRSERAAPETPGARQASLQYRRLGAAPGGCLVEFQPLTGRMHQIRLQSALHGHPIRGDVLYGAAQPFGPAAEARERIIALHARSLTFLHPLRYEAVKLTAALPDSWRELGVAADGDGRR
jgi:23S rRNA pseudouridine1911/1915/1917 synthase